MADEEKKDVIDVEVTEENKKIKRGKERRRNS